LYIDGVLVGGIGVMTEATYSIDPQPSVDDADNADEGVALAGQSGFAPPPDIEASNINIGGVTLDYAGPSKVHVVSSAAPAGGTVAALAVGGFYTPNGGGSPFYDGARFGTAASGIVRDSSLGAPSYPGTDGYVLVTAAGTPRFPPNVNGAALPSGDGAQIAAAEAQALAMNALKVAEVTRAGIRIPTNAHAEVTISVIDLDGNILAIVRTPDAPIFGTDVSLQKARSAVWFSRGDAKNAFTEVSALAAASSTASGHFSDYVTTPSAISANSAPTSVFNLPGGTAFSLLAVGALDRPYLPDGQNMPGNVHGNGPLALPLPADSSGNPIAGPHQWSPFSTGLQTDLIVPDLAAFLGGGAPPASGCGTAAGLPANASVDRNGASTT
ncbi:MAG: hypothetical protein ACREFQ_15815, partial [Stellaceae bacterium]